MKIKRKRKGIIITIAILALILIIVCVIHLSLFPILRNPHTNLEFWIGQKVEREDFSNYQQKYGLSGGYEYYGKGYTPTLDEYENQVDPEHCVIYMIQSYPDVVSPNHYVTNILITDPEIELYGINVNSTVEEFKKAMKKKGFRVQDREVGISTICVAKRGRCTITFPITSQEKYIEIDLDGTNIFRLIVE